MRPLLKHPSPVLGKSVKTFKCPHFVLRAATTPSIITGGQDISATDRGQSMDAANHLILLGGGLMLAAILTGALSTRIGAPLLLVFLGAGMLVGEDGPGGIQYNDYGTVYTLASLAVAVILFDGGLRTSFRTVRRSWGPAAWLATVGVVITAAITAAAAWTVFSVPPVIALLIGTVVASTDAAAVFLLLHQRGLEIRERVSATLELESGANDPMAILLTMLLVSIATGTLQAQDMGLSIPLALIKAFAIGGALGLAGGQAISWAVNRLMLAPGLYPVLVIAGALTLFGLSHTLGGSGFLTVYVAGIVVGNQRLRAQVVIRRFHDGIAWISQILLLVMLGLLVTPHTLVPDLVPAILTALAMVFVARPVAVALCLWRSRLTLRERLFVAWVGLRGGMPIYMAIIPVLSGVPEAGLIFNVTFIVVLVSLVLQGWSISAVARLLRVEIPPAPEPQGRLDIDIPSNLDQDIVGYTITADSPAAGLSREDLRLPARSRLLSVLRGNVVVPEQGLDQFQAGDFVLLLTAPEQGLTLDRLFLPKDKKTRRVALADFVIPGSAPLGSVCDAYEISVADDQRQKSIGQFVADTLGGTPGIGDSLLAGAVELVVVQTEGDRISSVGIRLEPDRGAAWETVVPRRLLSHIRRWRLRRPAS